MYSGGCKLSRYSCPAVGDLFEGNLVGHFLALGLVDDIKAVHHEVGLVFDGLG